VPASLYGILQHYGLDPLPWAGEVVERVSSSLGNAIFIAAYLLMVFFVTLYKALQIFGRLTSSKEATSIRDAVLGGVYLFIMAIQLIAIFFTQSRGPWLGLLGGLYAFVLILLVSLRQRVEGERRVTVGDLARGLGAGVGALLLGGFLAWVSIAKIGSPMLGLALLGAVAVLTYAILILSRKGLRRCLWQGSSSCSTCRTRRWQACAKPPTSDGWARCSRLRAALARCACSSGKARWR